MTDQLPSLRNFIIGLDAGASTGVAVLDRVQNKIIYSQSTNFCDAIDLIENNFLKMKVEVKIFVELPGKFVYSRNDGNRGLRMRDEMVRKIGGNRREAELLATMLRHKGFLVEEVAPVRQKKWDQRHFELFTKSKKRTNEHERDACRLAIYYANQR